MELRRLDINEHRLIATLKADVEAPNGEAVGAGDETVFIDV